MFGRTLIIVCGWPLAGKTTLARELAPLLGMRHLDIDLHVREPLFGKDIVKHPEASEKELHKVLEAMAPAYEILFIAAKAILGSGRDLIISAGFSKPIYWNMLKKTFGSTPPKTAVIRCVPHNDTPEEIQRRLERSSRKFGVNSRSNVNSVQMYDICKDWAEQPPVEHLILDTSPPSTLEESVLKARKYILSLRRRP